MFKVKHIDVENPDHMKLVTLHQVHRENPFVYRIECEKPSCKTQVWPSQMYDVRDFDAALTGGASFLCDGCVETWLRRPDIDFDVEKLMKAHGAKAADVKKWKDKCEAAKPNHDFIEEGNSK